MAATSPQAAAVPARSNVSVTSINCDGEAQFSFASTASSNQIPASHHQTNGIRISVQRGADHAAVSGGMSSSPSRMEHRDHSDTESETELSNIEFSQHVNLRDKRSNEDRVPRPMSWEGGLSDEDDDHMDTVEKADMDIKPDLTKDFVSKQTVDTDSQVSMSLSNDSRMSMTDVKYEPHQQLQLDSTVSAVNNGVISTNLYNGGVDLNCQSGMKGLHKSHGIIPDLLGSPLLARQHKSNLLPANPSPDSAIHSVYTHSSPSQSPLTARHTAPYTPSLSRNNSDASHSSCYSYSSEFSPAHSPIQGRHTTANTTHGSPLHHSVLVRGSSLSQQQQQATPNSADLLHLGGDVSGHIQCGPGDGTGQLIVTDRDIAGSGVSQDHVAQAGSPGISRQQLINSPCPICGDKISGFHYGIFSCESCKGFFKRTVQNRKNYVCLRGATCPVSVATRKKCPACRFDKCLQRGMKLEAIREDRTRGGRSTYQCSYAPVPHAPQQHQQQQPNCSPLLSGSSQSPMGHQHHHQQSPLTPGSPALDHSGIKSEPQPGGIPALLQEIMDVEHLWQYNESEINKFTSRSSSSSTSSSTTSSMVTNPLLARAGITGDDSNPDFLANLCNIADHRLYKIVKWCKSLPLFKNISIDDQICLLINSWCELLLFSCCYRSMVSPGEIRVSLGKSISLEEAKHSGLQACIERMLNLTEHLRRLRVDRYEYVAMKVIVLLTSDTSELREPEKVRASQEKALQALQAYTLSHYPHSPAKFGELLLRIPELQRTCQVGKEMLTIKSKDGEGPSFNLLMELLRGEH